MLDVLADFYPELTLEPASQAAASRGMKLRASAHYMDVISGDRMIRVALRHAAPYLYDVVTSFDSYFAAVAPISQNAMHLIDYSTPRWHDVLGFDFHPVHFPSFAEPVVTAAEYLDFAQLRPGSIVLDLGAYSGLTSILFDRQVGPGSRVVPWKRIWSMFYPRAKIWRLHERFTGRKIELLEGAIWVTKWAWNSASKETWGRTAIVGNQLA